KEIVSSSTNESSRVENRVNNFKRLWEEVPAEMRIVKQYADIGSGVGDIGLAIGKYLGLERQQIHLLDIEPHPGIELISNGTISFPNASIDLLTSFVSIHHFSNPTQMLNEMHRVTR